MNYEIAESLAFIAHEGQKDKGGNMYFHHLISVVKRLDTEEEKIVGVLHDIVEDTKTTLYSLVQQGFSYRVVDAINSITKRKNETYKHYLERVAENDLARKVKIADLLDNMDLSRIPTPSDEDYSRLDRYNKAYNFLREYELKIVA